MFKTIKKLLNSIHPLLFMVSFCIGLFFTYSLTSAPEILYVYPNPHNLQDTIYKDDSDKCFKYTSNNSSKFSIYKKIFLEILLPHL